MKNVINKKHYNLTNRSKEFASNIPFPHIFLEDFLNDNFFAEFQKLKVEKNKNSGQVFNTAYENKKWISKNHDLPDLTKAIINELNSEPWITNLQKLSNISGLFATLKGNDHLANYHEMSPGGSLSPHVDHSSEPETGFPHVLNIVVYLTDNWDESWGGGTDLLDRNGKKIITKVPYKPNSAVIFLHTPHSFHGVSKINENANLIRKSLYVDYYSSSFDPYKHFELNFDNRWFEHGTYFVSSNFFDFFKKRNFLYRKIKIDYLLNKFFR